MPENKRSYLELGMFNDLQQIQEEPVARWGKMNCIQMLEHLSHFFDVSADKIKYDLVTAVEYLPRYKEFLLSEKQFRENTKAPENIIGEEPFPARSSSVDDAITILKISVENFFHYFKNRPEAKTVHPAFGPLSFEEWVMLHYKHVTHHFRQFGILPALT